MSDSDDDDSECSDYAGRCKRYQDKDNQIMQKCKQWTEHSQKSFDFILQNDSSDEMCSMTYDELQKHATMWQLYAAKRAGEQLQAVLYRRIGHVLECNEECLTENQYYRSTLEPDMRVMLHPDFATISQNHLKLRTEFEKLRLFVPTNAAEYMSNICDLNVLSSKLRLLSQNDFRLQRIPWNPLSSKFEHEIPDFENCNVGDKLLIERGYHHMMKQLDFILYIYEHSNSKIRVSLCDFHTTEKTYRGMWTLETLLKIRELLIGPGQFEVQVEYISTGPLKHIIVRMCE